MAGKCHTPVIRWGAVNRGNPPDAQGKENGCPPRPHSKKC